MPCQLHITLPTPVKLSFHWTKSAALLAAPKPKPCARVIVERNTRLALYVAWPALPELAEAGDTLSGTYSVAKLGFGGTSLDRGAAKRPGGWGVSLVVPPPEAKDEKKESAADDPDEAPESQAALDQVCCVCSGEGGAGVGEGAQFC